LAFTDRAQSGPLRALLKRAQVDLNRRLAHVAPGDSTFSATQMQATLKQIRTVTDLVKHGLQGQVLSAGQVIAGRSVDATLRYLAAAEKRFQGVGGAGLSLRTAAVYERAVSGTQTSQLRRLMSDPDNPSAPGILQRYGDATVGHFEETLQTSLVARTPWLDVREQLTQASPFLQGQPLYWAERIVRTEGMFANQRASYLGMSEIDSQTGGQMIRIIMATFDDRTGADSISCHGQIRRMSEPFRSWFGEYMHPPNRPNDREVVVPHHMEWEIPESLKPKSDAAVLGRWVHEGRKGTPPARPQPMSTVPLDQIGVPQAPQQAPQQAPEAAPAAAAGGITGA